MKFEEAYNKLQKLVKGKYHSLQFEVVTYSDGETKTRCSLYIDGYDWTRSCRTWKEAFAHLENMVNPQKKNEEMPDISDHEDFAQEKRIE